MRYVTMAALVAAVWVIPSARADDARPAAKTPAAEAREDVRVEIARRTSGQVGTAEEGLKAATDAFAAAVAKFDLKAVDSLDLTAEAGLKACERLEAAFKDAAGRARSYQAAVKSLRAETEKAPEVYRQLAGYYRGEAGKTQTPTFKANYLKLAENSEAMAKVMEDRLKDLDALAAGGTADRKPAEGDVEVVTFLEEGTKFFRDMGAFFKATPGALSATERKRFKDDLKALAEQTNRFMEAFKAFSEKLKAAPVSQKLKAERERDLAAARERDRDRELGRAKALLAEADGLLAKRAEEWAVLEPALKAMVDNGQHAGARQALANWEASWRREAQKYASPAVTVAGGRAVATHAALVPAEHYPVVRGGSAAGFARVVRRLPAGGVEVEAVVGELKPGDTLLVRVV
ncbi:MAG: hypothetical protein C0501_04930 [Isosphaera sp.]|nr:hypothetical protein [Isosphaera sp.]